MIIAIDLDDVLADSLTAFVEFYNKKHKDKLKYDDFTAYTLNEIKGTPKEEEDKLLAEFDDSPYFKNIKPIKNAREALAYLSKRHKLIIVTSRTTEKEQKTRAWVKEYFKDVSDIFF